LNDLKELRTTLQEEISSRCQETPQDDGQIKKLHYQLAHLKRNYLDLLENS